MPDVAAGKNTPIHPIYAARSSTSSGSDLPDVLRLTGSTLTHTSDSLRRREVPRVPFTGSDQVIVETRVLNLWRLPRCTKWAVAWAFHEHPRMGVHENEARSVHEPTVGGGDESLTLCHPSKKETACLRAGGFLSSPIRFSSRGASTTGRTPCVGSA